MFDVQNVFIEFRLPQGDLVALLLLYPPTPVLKLRQFHSPHICLCLSEDTLKAGGPFYLVSMPGEVKDPTRGKCVTCSGLTNSREGQILR